MVFSSLSKLAECASLPDSARVLGLLEGPKSMVDEILPLLSSLSQRGGGLEPIIFGCARERIPS